MTTAVKCEKRHDDGIDSRGVNDFTVCRLRNSPRRIRYLCVFPDQPIFKNRTSGNDTWNGDLNLGKVVSQRSDDPAGLDFVVAFDRKKNVNKAENAEIDV